jgi:hypothetical protein
MVAERAEVMKFVLITKDEQMEVEARQGFHPSDELAVFDDWRIALEKCSDADLMFVDVISTLEEPHKIAGYEAFGEAKMSHPEANTVPLVVISPPEEYELDFIVGWPNFALANIQRPVGFKQFRRASTWV